MPGCSTSVSYPTTDQRGSTTKIVSTQNMYKLFLAIVCAHVCICACMCMHTHIWESEDYLQLFETKMLTAELVLNSPHMLEKGASESPGLHLSPSPQHWDSKCLPSYLVFNVSSGNPIHVFVLPTLNPRSLPTKLSTPALLSKTNC